MHGNGLFYIQVKLHKKNLLNKNYKDKITLIMREKGNLK